MRIYLRKREVFSLAGVALLLLVLLSSCQTVHAVEGYGSSPASFATVVATETLPVSPQAVMALDYVVTTYNLSTAELMVAGEEEVSFPLIGRTFRIVTIILNRPDEFRSFGVYVDLADGSVTEDERSFHQMEQEAHKAKYGKLHLTLYDLLQVAAPEDMFRVIIAVDPDAAGRTDVDRYADLAAQYPEAAEAMANGLLPWRVSDQQLRFQIEEQYHTILLADQRHVALLVAEAVRGLGFSAAEPGPLGVVEAELTKTGIDILIARADVTYIYPSGSTAPAKGEVDSETGHPGEDRLFLPVVVRP
jgi:hypothetical protein